ncbi:hypothetical protein PoB_002804100, partial [Plakobranchus ocellatus]
MKEKYKELRLSDSPQCLSSSHVTIFIPGNNFAYTTFCLARLMKAVVSQTVATGSCA